jgi:hypothetical protein
MASRQTKRAGRKVKSLKPKSVSGKKAKAVKGGIIIQGGIVQRSKIPPGPPI